MSELSDIVSDQPIPVTRIGWASDKKALVLRVLILLTAVAGGFETLRGLRNAWQNGVEAGGALGAVQQVWGLFPYGLLLLIAAFRVSKRSLVTLQVAALLCWFMSTGYFNLDEMEMAVFVIPFIQLTFVAGALAVMFTFWLLRKR